MKKLEIKTPILAGIFFIAMVVLLFVFIYTFFLNQSSELEKILVKDNIQRVAHAIDLDGSNMLISLRDYAVWDDTYNFIKSKDPKYIGENILSGSFDELHINYVAAYDLKGNLIVSRNRDWQNRQDLPVTEAYKNIFKNYPDLFSFKDTSDKKLALVVLDGQMMIIGTSPIIPSSKIGQSDGTLLMARNIDDSLIKRISESTMLNVSIMHDLNQDMLTSIFAPENTLKENKKIAIQFTSDKLYGYYQLTSLNSAENITIRLDLDRSVYHLTLKLLGYFYFFFAIWGAIIMVFYSIVNHRLRGEKN